MVSELESLGIKTTKVVNVLILVLVEDGLRAA